jgi:hypothetical protein
MLNLKKVLLIAAATMSFTSVYAQDQLSFSRVSLVDQTTTKIHLNRETVRCSALGYGLEELKISVPILKRFAAFDHANEGEALPCMTAGLCDGGFGWPEGGWTVSGFLEQVEPIEEATIQRELKEHFHVNFVHNTCVRNLTETLQTVIKGVTFNHVVTKSIGQLPFEVCMQIHETL